MEVTSLVGQGPAWDRNASEWRTTTQSTLRKIAAGFSADSGVRFV